MGRYENLRVSICIGSNFFSNLTFSFNFPHVMKNQSYYDRIQSSVKILVCELLLLRKKDFIWITIWIFLIDHIIFGHLFISEKRVNLKPIIKCSGNSTESPLLEEKQQTFRISPSCFLGLFAGPIMASFILNEELNLFKQNLNIVKCQKIAV